MHITDTHVYFYTNSFSNWHPARFTDTVTGLTFHNSEQAFMWYKAHLFNDQNTKKKILETKSASEAKALGREVRDYDEKRWVEARLAFMIYVCYLKFSQNKDLHDELLATGDKVLVEASVPDRVWGVGLAENDPDILDETKWRGQNLLGKALMRVRELLIEDIANNNAARDAFARGVTLEQLYKQAK